LTRLGTVFGHGLFSVGVWTFGFTWMLLSASVTLLLLAAGLPYQRVHVWFTGPTFAWTVRVALIRVRVHRHPRFDPDERSVFCQNHINLFDGHIASAAIPHAFSGLMNAWQFKIPIYGWLMAMSKGIPVKKMRRDKVIEDISKEARQRKEIGMSVLTFPEGHRTRTGRPGPFKRGVFLMARNAGMSVVPIAVKGLYEANNKNMGWIFHPFKTVDVFLGPQFSTAGLDNEQVGELADRLRTWIDDCVRNGAFPELEASEQKHSAA
jgi:1-acyl-sn-glycerol-3-phosphate acyltransferase